MSREYFLKKEVKNKDYRLLFLCLLSLFVFSIVSVYYVGGVMPVRQLSPGKRLPQMRMELLSQIWQDIRSIMELLRATIHRTSMSAM